MNLLWLLIYPACALAALILLGAFCAWDEMQTKRTATHLLAEDRQVAALDAVWELPAREHA